MSRPRSRDAFALAALAVGVVLYAGACKALLFRGLEYYHTDFFGFVEMSRSLLTRGELLTDNVYGHHSAIHNYYLMLAFAPLTQAFGAYGLILGLVLLHAAAALRTALAPTLDLAGRAALLGAGLGPIAWFVFDNPVFGFHTELCYPPLAVLLALDLREGRTRRAILLAALVTLVKEDGAVLLASVLVAHFALRLFELRSAPWVERRAVLAAAARSLAAASLAFLAGMALLWAMSHAYPQARDTASARLGDAIERLRLAGAGGGVLRDNLAWGLAGYLAVTLLTLLPLGRRLWRGLVLVLVSAPPLVAVLVVSAGVYRFRYMLWPLRLAELLALVLACGVFASARAGESERRSLLPVLGLVTLSFSLQLVALQRSEGYRAAARLDAPALWQLRGTRAAAVPPEELRFLRCLGRRLPRGLPVEAFGDLQPVFHRQSVVFELREQFARAAPKVRVIPAAAAGRPLEAGFCASPGVGRLAVEAECRLLPLVDSCRQGRATS